MRKLPRGWGPEGQPGASTGPESRSSLRGGAQERSLLLQDPRGVPRKEQANYKGKEAEGKSAGKLRLGDRLLKKGRDIEGERNRQV